MIKNLEKNLKRFLKRKVKLTTGLIVVFLITGSLGFAVEEDIEYIEKDWRASDFQNGKTVDFNLEVNGIRIWAPLQEETIINFNGHTCLVNDQGMDTAVIWQGVSRYEDNNITINIGDNKNFYLSNSEGTILQSDAGKLNINGGKIVMEHSNINPDVDGAYMLTYSNGTININNADSLILKKGTFTSVPDSISTSVGMGGYGHINVGVKENIWGETSGSLVLLGKDTSVNLEVGNSIYFKSIASDYETYNGVGIYVDSGVKSVTSVKAGNDITFETDKQGIYTLVKTTQNSNIDIESKNGDITFISKNSNAIEINAKEDNINGTSNVSMLGNNIYLTGKESAISSKGNSIITLNSKENLYLTSTEENKNVATIHIEGKDEVNENSKVNLISKQLQIKGDTGINSIDNGKVTLNSSSTNIIAKDDGIRTGNHGSVTINTTNKEKENKENSVLVSSDLRALTTATENADNGGKIDITSSSINLVGNKVKDENIYTGTNNMNLKVQSVVFGYRGDINLNGDINIISENNESLGDENRIYAGVQSRGGSTINLNGKTYISSKDGVALYATDLREIDGTETTNPNRVQSTIDLSDVGNHTLLGDIVAGKNSIITIGGSDNYIGKREDATKEIEILAANEGTVNLNLIDGILVGRVDNYYEANEKGEQGNSTIDDSVFRNDKFYKEISSGGTVNLIMDEKTTWVAKGQSYISNINYDIDKKEKIGDNFGLIDMSTEEGTSVNIKNLGSNGTFKIKLNSDIAQGYNVASDMIYIQNITSDNTVIEVIAEDAIHLNAGEKLRFATVGEKTDSNCNNNVVFNVLDVKEKGIKNVSFEVGNEEYDKENTDINEKYNGVTTEIGKPGNEFVDKEYGNGTNHYLTKNEDTDEGGDSNVNDGGTTIVEMGKSTYANAVYMDNLNKRLGDMSFATGDEGIWVRMRNDRVGEDEHYRLHNYMTQLGYDKKYTVDNGNEHRGIAFEYGRGDLDFKQLNGGELKSDKYILTLYDTRVRNNGVYTDYTLRGGAIATDFTSYGRETGNEVNGSYKNMLLGAGVEGGKRFDINENWYFEPQAQLQYTFIDSTYYTTNQSTKVELDSIHSLIGRAGFRLGHDYYNENRKDNTIYVKADINHEFLGDQNIKAIDSTGSLDKTYKNEGTWYDIGIGGAKNITPDFNVYMDVEKQFGDNRDSNSWQFNVGFRYRFNELKDLNPVVMLRDFSLRADNYFDFDKSELKPEGKKVIKKVSEELTKEKAKGTLKIEGHTDWTGTREYNQKLSERRAKSVEEELRKNITTDRIKYETKGYGEDKPIADNATKEGRAKNRRVDIKFEGVGER